MRYTLNSILRDIINGKELTAEQLETIQSKLQRDADRTERQKALRKQQREDFKREIMEILESVPCVGFTATDIQFLIPDFVARHITNQKVSAYICDLMEDGKITRYATGYKKAFFYYGDTLNDFYRGEQFSYINGKRFLRIDGD